LCDAINPYGKNESFRGKSANLYSYIYICILIQSYCVATMRTACVTHILLETIAIKTIRAACRDQFLREREKGKETFKKHNKKVSEIITFNSVFTTLSVFYIEIGIEESCAQRRFDLPSSRLYRDQYHNICTRILFAIKRTRRD